MKIRPVSDLHLEIHSLDNFEPAGEDLLILAGDIGVRTLGLDVGKQIARNFNIPVIMIAGNHEFYRSVNMQMLDHTWEGTLHDLRAAADLTDAVEPGKLTFLEDQTVFYDGVRFIGSTLWTDMAYFGDPNFLVEMAVEKYIRDYHVIVKKDRECIRVADTVARHKASLDYLYAELTDPFDGTTVVITHHTPSQKSVHESYRNDHCTAAFSSKLEDLILDYGPKLWLHGHTHHPFDYKLGKTRIVCNPRGYPNEKLGFDPNLIVEI